MFGYVLHLKYLLLNYENGENKSISSINKLYTNDVLT